MCVREDTIKPRPRADGVSYRFQALKDLPVVATAHSLTQREALSAQPVRINIINTLYPHSLSHGPAPRAHAFRKRPRDKVVKQAKEWCRAAKEGVPQQPKSPKAGKGGCEGGDAGNVRRNESQGRRHSLTSEAGHERLSTRAVGGSQGGGGLCHEVTKLRGAESGDHETTPGWIAKRGATAVDDTCCTLRAKWRGCVRGAHHDTWCLANGKSRVRGSQRDGFAHGYQDGRKDARC